MVIKLERKHNFGYYVNNVWHMSQVNKGKKSCFMYKIIHFLSRNWTAKYTLCVCEIIAFTVLFYKYNLHYLQQYLLITINNT